MLEALTCGTGEPSDLSKILLVPETQKSMLQAYRSTVCNGEAGQRAERFKQLSLVLREQINTQSVLEKVQREYPFLYFIMPLNVGSCKDYIFIKKEKPHING